MSADAISSLSATLATTASMTQVEPDLFARPVSLSSVESSVAATGAASLSPDASPIGPAVSGPFTPAQIRQAYGIDQLPETGAGQTIAVVDAYDNPNIVNDLTTFDSEFSLPAINLVKAYPNGSVPASNSGWSLETALDVEWAHAIAPGATIMLVEAASASTTNLFKGVDYAVTHGASQVSMSWGGSEYSGVTSLDSNFMASGVSFFASAGDSGAGVEFPAVSPYVTGVGGTTVSLDAAGDKISETTWSGSGGGTSAYVARPSYQTGFQSSSDRGAPDVAYDADPNSGVFVYDNGSYYGVGGTSAGSPQWAGLAALVNQGRVANGLATIGTGLPYGLNTALYSLAGGSSYTNPNGDFFDITSGSNGNPATTGYDTATGLGSPVANKLVPDLIAFGAPAASPTTPATPAVGDSSFETVSAGSGFYGFVYDPTGSAWNYTGTAGVTANNSAFTQNNGPAPEGQQAAFLQGNGVISQTITNWAAGSYTLSLQAAQRTNYGTPNQSIEVLVDGNVVATFNPQTATYQSFTTSAFSVGAGTHTISFVGMNTNGDNTAFIDDIALQATNPPALTATVGDSGFETVSAGSGFYGFVYDPTGSAWNYTGTAGVTANSSAFTQGDGPAPEGQQAAFLQGNGVISQTITNWAAGSYTLSLQAAQRTNYGTPNQSIEVLVDGNVVATFNPQTATYQSFTTSAFSVGAGTHTISFVGMNTNGDNTAFIDDIQLASV